MEFLGFAFSVWAAIVLGVFTIAMIIGVTFDRRGQESTKWWVFWLGLIALCVYIGKESTTTGFSWQGVLAMVQSLLVPVAIYLGIGLAYSVLEFMLEVRRSARKWSDLWKTYKFQHANEFTKSPEVAANSFVSNHRLRTDLITVERNPDELSKNFVVPRVNRGRLAGFIGAWTFFWPFYAISLIIGDLLSEVFRIVADFFAHISGRFVRVVFKDVFN